MCPKIKNITIQNNYEIINNKEAMVCIENILKFKF